MYSLCLALAALLSSQLRMRAVGGTQPPLWMAHTVEWVPVRTMISFLDSVAVARVGSECPQDKLDYMVQSLSRMVI
jgi:hypothetical protein